MTFRRAMFSTIRFLLDWRTGLTFCASLFVALLLAVVVTGAQTTREALDTRNRTAAAAARRIDLLNERIEILSGSVEDNNRVIGELRQQVADLSEQVRQLGGEPVVRTSTTSGQTTTTTAPSETTTTTAAPEPDDDDFCVGPVCIRLRPGRR